MLVLTTMQGRCCDMENNEIKNNDNNMILYQDENNITRVSVRFSDEDLWLTQAQIAELYDTTQQNISQHIESIFRDVELQKTATNKKFLLVRTEGTRQVKRNIDHYNLDMIIALVNVSHKQAIEKAEKEFEIYRAREMRQFESDFDRVVKMLNDNNGKEI